MKKQIPILTLILILYSGEISAQENKWTLQDCINYAITNNIGLQRQRLMTLSADVNLLTSKMNVLPSINLASDVQIGFGRSIDPTSNLVTFSQNLLNSFYVSSNIELFSGFAKLNTIAANKFMLSAGLETEKIARNTLIVDLMGQYYQVFTPGGWRMHQKCSLIFLKNSISES